MYKMYAIICINKAKTADFVQYNTTTIDQYSQDTIFNTTVFFNFRNTTFFEETFLCACESLFMVSS